MPLSQAQTPGLRIMLWVMPVITMALGLSLLLLPDSRFRAPGFEPGRLLFAWTDQPMRIHSVFFLLIAAAKVVAIVRHQVHPFIVAMCLGLGLYVFWAVLFLVAFFHDDRTSSFGVILCTGWAVLHVAALRSLTEPAPARADDDA